jgi:hypothetical protein
MKLVRHKTYCHLQYMLCPVLPRDEWLHGVTIMVPTDEQEWLRRHLESPVFETTDELIAFLRKKHYMVSLHGNALMVSVIRPSDDCHTYS